MRRELPCDRLHRGHRAAGDQTDAAHLHFHAQLVAQIVVETAQNVFAAIDERHVGAEPGENAGELDGDVAAALDQHAVGQLGEDGTPRSTK